MPFLARRLAVLAGLTLPVLLGGHLTACDGENLGPSPTEVEVSFSEPGTLALSPGETRAIGLRVSPPVDAPVTLALVGDALDASIDRPSVVPDAAGRASVTLRAPSEPTTFRLRAKLEGAPPAELPVSVSSLGFGRIRVEPAYKGQREVGTWVAGVVARTSCAKLGGPLPDEPPGALVATAPEGGSPTLESVPVGPSLSVTLRAKKYLWGCRDVSELEIDETRTVRIEAQDKPLVLAGADLSLELAFAPEPAPWAKLLEDAAEALLARALPADVPEPELLLDAMAALLGPVEASTFSLERTAGGWDEKLAAHFAAGKVSLFASAGAAVTAGLEQLAAAAPHALEARLRGEGAGEGLAYLEARALGPVDGPSAGMAPSVLVKWSGEPGDSVRLGGSLPWEPSRFVGAASDLGAAFLDPGAKGVAALLADAVDCPAVGALLGDSGSCASACLAALCAAALEARWELGRSASAAHGDHGSIEVQVSATAEIDDAAVPISLSGTWLGMATDGTHKANVYGPASGESAAAP